MESVYENFNKFQAQLHNPNDMIRQQDLLKQVIRLKQIKRTNQYSLNSQDQTQLQKNIKIYQLSIKQIQKMKMKFTKPTLVNEKIIQIFNGDLHQVSQQIVQKSIRTDEVQIPSFKNKSNDQNHLNSPTLKGFFQKKQAQILGKSTISSNFKQILKNEQNKSLLKSNYLGSSGDQVSRISRSSSSSFKKKPRGQQVLKKVLQQNLKIKNQYQKKLKRQLDLSEFQKNLLKQQKNRYMSKIQELEIELENIYRDNYRLKQEEELFKQNQAKSKINNTQFYQIDKSLRRMDQTNDAKDYYQPYVMKTKHNDLKKLVHFTQQKPANLIVPQKNTQPQIKYQNADFDILGDQLQKQLKSLEQEKIKSNKSNSFNVSQRSTSKKWGKQFNPHIYQSGLNTQKDFQKNQTSQNDIFRDFDQLDQKRLKQCQLKSNLMNLNQNPFQKYGQQHDENMILKGIDLSLDKDIHMHSPPIKKTLSRPVKSRDQVQQILYKPASNYSFTKNHSHPSEYSMQSNGNSFQTFNMTRTYLQMDSQVEQSNTNKYIDSRTSTRNKVAFFKDSLILIKNQKFEVAFKRSALVPSKDRVRMIFFIKNKSSSTLKVNFHYEYDAFYFKLKVNHQLQSIAPGSQSRQDLQIYGFSQSDLNQVIDILIQVNGQKYGLWMPVMWIQFNEIQNFRIPNQVQTLSIIPDRQFKNYQSAKIVMPIMYGGKDGGSHWAYLYGNSKFGPCFVKLTWEHDELKIQANSKYIDLLAFVMHHVK